MHGKNALLPKLLQWIWNGRRGGWRRPAQVGPHSGIWVYGTIVNRKKMVLQGINRGRSMVLRAVCLRKIMTPHRGRLPNRRYIVATCASWLCYGRMCSGVARPLRDILVWWWYFLMTRYDSNLLTDHWWHRWFWHCSYSLFRFCIPYFVGRVRLCPISHDFNGRSSSVQSLEQ